MSILAKKVKDELSNFIEIYNESGILLSKSENSSLECLIRHKFDGLEYICMPNSDEILVTFDSLKSKFSK